MSPASVADGILKLYSITGNAEASRERLVARILWGIARVERAPGDVNQAFPLALALAGTLEVSAVASQPELDNLALRSAQALPGRYDDRQAAPIGPGWLVGVQRREADWGHRPGPAT